MRPRGIELSAVLRARERISDREVSARRPRRQCRAKAAGAYLDAHGVQLLAALDDIAATHHTTPAAVSLAWLLAQPTIVAPIASARTVEQLAEWLPAAALTLTDEEVARLNR